MTLCDELNGRSGRVIGDDWRISAFLPSCASVEVINGVSISNPIEHAYVNATHLAWLEQPYREFDAVEWNEATDIYAIRWILVNNDFRHLDWYTLASFIDEHPGTATSIGTFGPYELFEVDSEPSELQITASYDRLRVTDAPVGTPILLSYHWLNDLTTVPESVTIEPYPVPGLDDPVPFILVTSPDTSDFVICLEGRCDQSE